MNWRECLYLHAILVRIEQNVVGVCTVFYCMLEAYLCWETLDISELLVLQFYSFLFPFHFVYGSEVTVLCVWHVPFTCKGLKICFARVTMYILYDVLLHLNKKRS